MPAWLQPLAEEAEVVPGWTLRDIGLQRSEVRLGLTEGSGSARHWLVIAPSPSGRFEVQCPADVAPPACARVRDLMATRGVAQSPWQQAKPEGPKPVPWLLRPPRPLVLSLWVGLLTLLTVRGWQQRRRDVVLPALGVTLLGLAIRLWLAPRTLLHEYYHAALSTEFLHDGSVSRFGETVQAPALVLDHFWGTGLDGLFAVNLVCATLAVPAWVWLDAALLGPRPMAWLTGVMAACLPMFIRFSSCEESVGAIALLVAVSLAAWRTWLDESRWLLLAITVISALLALLARPEMLALPVLHVALLLAVRGLTGLRLLLRPTALLGLAAFVGLAASRWHIYGGERISRFGLAQFTNIYALLDPGSLLPVFVLLLLAGLVHLWRRDWPLALWFAASHAAITLASLSFFMTTGAFAQRTQVLPTLFVLPLISQGVTAQVQRWPRFQVPLVALTLALVAGAVFVQRQDIADAGFAQQAEWQFLQAAAPKLPPHLDLYARAGVGHVAAFPPVVLSRAHRDASLHDLPTLALRNQWPQPGPDQVLYLGMYCYIRAVEDGDNLDVPSATCTEARRRYELVPLAEASLPARPYPPALHWSGAGGSYQVGFYRIARVRPGEAAP